MGESLHLKLKKKLKDLVTSHGHEWCEELESTVPRKWHKHGDLILVSTPAFFHAVWEELGLELWEIVKEGLKCKRIARKSFIKNDDFRSPQVELLHGNDSWVTHVDNGISYSFDVLQCMFSAGNISEKMRVASFDCRGETVVDLFAGIGYFTLPYLVHAEAETVYACEWNPASICALHRNLQDNGVDGRCHMLPGNNTLTCPKGIADRVNLGLIPSSESAWSTACSALKPVSGGVLHIHTNVESYSQKKAPSASHKKCDNLLTSAKLTEQTSSLLQCDYVRPVERDSKPRTDCGCEGSNSWQKLDSLSGSGDGNVNCSPTNVESVNRDDLTANVSQSKHGDSDPLPVESDRQTGNKIPSMKQKNQWKCKFSKTRTACEEWIHWAETTKLKIVQLCEQAHGGHWTSEVLHIEHVKKYAPHVDHIVLDLKCSPLKQ